MVMSGIVIGAGSAEMIKTWTLSLGKTTDQKHSSFFLL